MERFDKLPLSLKLMTLAQMFKSVRNDYIQFVKQREESGFTLDELKQMGLERLLRRGEDRTKLDEQMEVFVNIVDNFLDLKEHVRRIVDAFGVPEYKNLKET